MVCSGFRDVFGRSLHSSLPSFPSLAPCMFFLRCHRCLWHHSLSVITLCLWHHSLSVSGNTLSLSSLSPPPAHTNTPPGVFFITFANKDEDQRQRGEALLAAHEDEMYVAECQGLLTSHDLERQQ